MTKATIHQNDDRIGFTWLDSRGTPASLASVAAETDSEPERLVPTHLEALDDALIVAAGRLGEVLGGSRRPSQDELSSLADLYRTVDRAAHEYDEALSSTGLPAELRSGQIIGTASLMGFLARGALGLTGPAPLADSLATPPEGVVAGFGELVAIEPGQPARGARWVIRTESGDLLPASLAMLIFDSSGVNKDAALDEHREALRGAIAARDAADPLVVASAIDWLLHDWLMAHRTDDSSGAVEITSGKLDDALMIVHSAAASARLRATYDPGLLAVPRTVR